MEYRVHFREKDIPTAEKEVNCIKDLLHSLKKHIDSGDIVQAKNRDEDLKKSLENLITLNELKLKEDRHEALTR